MSKRRDNRPLTDERRDLAGQHVKLAYRLAHQLGRKLPKKCRGDVLISDACLGLTQAAQSYDPSCGVAFGAYARKRIWGAMLDGLRSRRFTSRWALKKGAADPKFYSLSEVKHERDGRDVYLADIVADWREQPGDRERYRDAVRHESRGCSREQRDVVVRFYADGRSMHDIARELGVTPSSISKMHADAMCFMRERLPAS